MSSPESDSRQVEPAPMEPRWGLGDVVAGFVAGLMLSSVLASIWLGATGRDKLGLGGQAFSQIGLWTGLVGAAVYAARRKGSGSVTADFGFRGRPVDLAIGAVAGVIAQAVLLPLIALLMQPLIGDPDVSGPSEELFEDARGVGIFLLLLFVVVGAAVVEELFFRGLLLRSLRRRLGTVPAVLISAVVFGVAHPLPLPAKGLALVWVSLAVLGVVLAVLAVRTGRLGPAIVAHAAFNAWTAVFLLAK